MNKFIILVLALILATTFAFRAKQAGGSSMGQPMHNDDDDDEDHEDFGDHDDDDHEDHEDHGDDEGHCGPPMGDEYEGGDDEDFEDPCGEYLPEWDEDLDDEDFEEYDACWDDVMESWDYRRIQVKNRRQ